MLTIGMKRKFDELLELAERGDHRHIDMLVRDIYGGDYHTLGLPGDLIASSFGKAAYLSRMSQLYTFETSCVIFVSLMSKVFGIEGKGLEYNEADVARSLLFTISNDIGQISCLYAIQHSLKDVYFGGYFLRGHPLSMHTISYAINYWGKGQVRALFLRHEGYLGAIGAFLKGAHEDPEKYSWSENYAGSSGLRSPIPMQLLNPKYSVSMDQLEMDQFHMQLSFCPLLANPHIYKPDTVDLNQDTQAREYWLQLFEETVDGFIEEAVRSQAETPDSVFLSSSAYGKLTVRSLLDMREHMLNESEFDDPYLLRKQEENEAALKSLASRLKYLDALGYQERQVRLIEGILAGNVFDWGAKEVAACLRQGNFHFDDAHQSLQKRPWLMDDLDVWMRRREEGPSYRCVAVFVDNSGMDIILGVIPFVRDFLSAGSQVLLCANSAPALNDVTYRELKVLMEDVAKVCPVIKDALAQGILSILESGQGSPCLDLSRLSRELCEAMESRGVDLVVLEGMGRAVHTNFHAEFTCDTLHLAVIKNRWLAQRLGGDMYAIICLFRQPTLS
ncbi:unnamed protein product [Darwinula stevensoni]|uniref:4'-phosphopantetheine phosphatase n=1 Tax=Darwinula stevensoni TaxID=69355 RepID=A0A7R9A202_9CRUS|nr:unnamed protein product [Darwinula stevensoni]CAG0878879.1 unnamed protein product [Darwinula stevensoni]